MSTLQDLIAVHTDLSANTSEHLHRLAAEWQLLADLSFADLLLWAPVRDGSGYICLAQVRPTTGPTAYDDDQVGRIISGTEAEHLHVSFTEGRIFR